MPQQAYYQHYCNTTNASTTTAQIIWPQWTTSQNTTVPYQNYQPTFYTQTTSTTISPDQIWQQWVNTPNITYGTYGVSPQQFHIETPEEMEARREERERDRQERVVARARARILLEEFLSDEQKVELEHHGRFHVTGSKGRRYCIHTSGQSGNVDLLKADGSLQATLCAHPRNSLPDGDAWLMQMIELRHDEDHFLRTANVHRGSLPLAA
jgi:hypothetical protein